MKPDTRSRKLLDDLLVEDDALKADLLEATLADVRRRRRRRSGLQAAALGVLGCALIWVGKEWRSFPDRVVAGPRPGPEIVASSPLPAGMLVRTGFSRVETISSEAGPAVVTTEDSAVPVIDDQELFSLLAGRPAMIVRPEGEPARLLLPDDPAGSPFRVN